MLSSIKNFNQLFNHNLFNFIFHTGITIIIIISICTLYKLNWVLFLLSCILFILVFLYRPSRFKLIMALITILLEMPMNYLYLRYDLWRYKNPNEFIDMPIWDPILLSIVFIAFGEISACLHQKLSKILSRRGYHILLGFLAVLILSYAAFTILNISFVYSIWALIGLIPVLLFAHRPFNIIFFWVSAIIGTIGEIIIIKYDIWYYTRPYFPSLGIPLSLTLAYGMAPNFFWILTMLFTKSWKKETGFEVN